MTSLVSYRSCPFRTTASHSRSKNQVTATARTLAYAQTGAGKPHGIGTATGALDDAELLDISASYLASGLGAMSTKSAGL